MGARERSLNNAEAVFKYANGFFFSVFGLFVFNREHPVGTGVVTLGFLLLGAFFLSVTRVEPCTKELKYRRWFRWRAVPYSEIVDCGESWVYGYIRLRDLHFPSRTIYFVRASASDSLFGLDKTVISTIRARANL